MWPQVFLWLPGPSSCVRRVLPQQCHRVIGLVRTYTTFFWPQVLLILFASPALLAAGTFAFVPLTRPSGRRCFCFFSLKPIIMAAGAFCCHWPQVLLFLLIGPNMFAAGSFQIVLSCTIIVLPFTYRLNVIICSCLGSNHRTLAHSVIGIHHVARSVIGIHHVVPPDRAGAGLSHLLLDERFDHL